MRINFYIKKYIHYIITIFYILVIYNNVYINKNKSSLLYINYIVNNNQDYANIIIHTNNSLYKYNKIIKHLFNKYINNYKYKNIKFYISCKYIFKKNKYIFYIHPYITKFIINKITIHGNKNISTNKLLKYLHIIPGDIYNSKITKKNILQKLEKIRQKYLNKGFILFEYKIIKNVNLKNHINLIIKIKEGGKFKINKIFYSGNIITNNNVINKTIDIKKGDVFSIKKLKKNIIKLYKLNIFEYENIFPILEINKKKKYINILWLLKEKNPNKLDFKLSYNSKNITGNFNIKMNNLSIKKLLSIKKPQGDAEKVYLITQIGKNFHKIDINFQKLIKNNNKIYINYNFLKKNKNNIFDKDIFYTKNRLSVGYNKKKFFFKKKYNIQEYLNFEQSQKNKIKYNNINYNININNNSLKPNNIYPTKGAYIDVDITLSPFNNNLINYLNTKNSLNKWQNNQKIQIEIDWYKKLYQNIIANLNSSIIIDNVNHNNYTKQNKDIKDNIISKIYKNINIYDKINTEIRIPVVSKKNISKIWCIFFIRLNNHLNILNNKNTNLGIGLRSFIDPIKFIGIDITYKINYQNSNNNKWTTNIIFGNNI